MATSLTATLAAVRDGLTPVLGRNDVLEGIDVPAGRDYFNTGVMLVDVARWIGEDIPSRAAQFLIEHPDEARWWDQDALNVVLDDRWQRLEPECNAPPLRTFMPGLAESWRFEDVVPLERMLQAQDDAVILHYHGPFKPWNSGYPPGDALDHYQRAESHLAEVLAAG